MKEEEALRKVQIALDNDAEVYVSRIEQCEGSLDHIARNYQGMLNLTTTLDETAEKHQEAKEELQSLLGQLHKADAMVSKLEALGSEIEEYTGELDVKIRRLWQATDERT